MPTVSRLSRPLNPLPIKSHTRCLSAYLNLTLPSLTSVTKSPFYWQSPENGFTVECDHLELEWEMDGSKYSTSLFNLLSTPSERMS